MKLFHFYRSDDHSGVSGTGPVAEGVQFSNGWCALRWTSQQSSICFYQSLEDMRSIHGHGGRTEIVVHEFEPLRSKANTPSSRTFEILMQIIDEASRLIVVADEPKQKEISSVRLRFLVNALDQEFEKKINR
jgi:hypothetical protein